MRHIHRKIAEVSHWIMFPVLFMFILGIAILIVVIEKPSDPNSVLVKWVNESFSR